MVLRAVAPGEKPARRPKTITQAAASGSHRELLVTTRARLAKAVESEGTAPRDLASLSKRLMDVDKEIRALDAAAQGSEDGRGDDGPAEDEAFDPEAI